MLTVSQLSQVIKLKPLKLSGLWLPALFVVVTGGILTLLIFAMLAYQVLYLDRIYPGVLVDGQPVYFAAAESEVRGVRIGDRWGHLAAVLGGYNRN